MLWQCCAYGLVSVGRSSCFWVTWFCHYEHSWELFQCLVKITCFGSNNLNYQVVSHNCLNTISNSVLCRWHPLHLHVNVSSYTLNVNVMTCIVEMSLCFIFNVSVVWRHVQYLHLVENHQTNFCKTHCGMKSKQLILNFWVPHRKIKTKSNDSF